MKRKKKIYALLIVLIPLLTFTAVVPFIISGNKKEIVLKHRSKLDISSLTKGRVTPQSLSSLINEHTKSIPKPTKIGNNPPARQTSSHSHIRTNNSKKDEEIVRKYAALSMSHLSHRKYSNPSPAGRPSARFGRGGGVFIMGNKKKQTESPELPHNVALKVRLIYSIRSTSSAPVIAEVIRGYRGIPAGSRLFGRPNGFANKRTQVRFSEIRYNGKKIPISAFAVSGRDPGIPSEIIDLSSNLHQTARAGAIRGITSVTAGVAGSVAGGGIGSTAQQIITPTGSEAAAQQQNNKIRQEFRVPAGTLFSVYME